MVHIAGDNVISSLGFTTSENIDRLIKGVCVIKLSDDKKISQVTVPVSLVDSNRLESEFGKILPDRQYTRLEKISLLSIKDPVSWA